MNSGNFAAVVLAAGKGTRMKSARPKVLHEVAGRAMLAHVLEAAANAGASRTVLVTAPDQDEVRDAAAAMDCNLEHAIQGRQLGTGDAVKCALPALSGHEGPILILCGDTPLLSAESLKAVSAGTADGTAICLLGFEARDPTGYGRLITDKDGQVLLIREELEASEEERAIVLCNSGVMAFRSGKVLDLLDELGNDNAKGEVYLTDIVEAAAAEGLRTSVTHCDEDEVLGVNSRAQLAQAEAIMQARLRASAMVRGVTLQAPETVFLSFDTSFGTDVTVEPNVIFGTGVDVGSSVTIQGHSHLAGVSIADNVSIGPFARLRPGTRLEAGARIGNFVEVKNATVETGAKVNHLAYIGDARVGSSANVGAGTITCNYDGANKHFTDIGAGAFIGSNSALVAPVKIGEGAYVGSGSVITKDVSPDALALARAPQSEKLGWAARWRAMFAKKPSVKPQKESVKG